MELIFKYPSLFSLPKPKVDFTSFAFHASERIVTKRKRYEKTYSTYRKISDIGDSLTKADDDDTSPDDPVECDSNFITSLPIKYNPKGET